MNAERDPSGDPAADDPVDDRSDASGTTPVDGTTEPAELRAVEALEETAVTANRPWWHLVLRIVGGVVIVAVIIAVLADKVPSPAEIGDALRRANWWWVAAGLFLQAASVGMLVRQQRRLLKAFGIPIRFSRMAAITYSSTAISMSMPAGGAFGAGWSYRQYRASGASSATAAAVLLLSGVLSVIALVLLYLAGLGFAGLSRLRDLGLEYPVRVVLIGLAGVAVVAGLSVLISRGAQAIPSGPRKGGKYTAWAERHPRLGAAASGLLSTGRRAQRVPVRDWRFALITSIGNWGLDAACLYVCCLAVGVRIDLFQLGLIYLGIQLVRQIPLTPGGIGVVEASLLAALVAAGAAEGPASAAVLLYRLFSAWLIVPVGYGMMWLLRKRRAAERPATGNQV
ncbi:lysylphosphatidylglycerol synthase transmembrane domain-containing protein [Nakamurella alba]|uniref:lysylphosphatidylglycerol synthase transmembrane domain-containing protein n=1 Tax=Nakamurella alba TaxID=2665158 RepID=UPI0018A8CE1B|nr:YbhN family protein [Nakamurella alba]